MILRLPFVKTSPSGNTTILVNAPVERRLHGRLSRLLMAPESLCAEQVAFREPSCAARERMQMMGGEFCVNAAMSMAACFLWEDGGAEGAYPLEASGREDVFTVRAKRVETDVYDCEAPLRCRVEGDVVRITGITHRIMESEPDPDAETRLRRWGDEDGGEAYGFLFTGGDVVRPLVYVPASDTVVWENACGSGAAALAAWQAHREGLGCDIRVSMPGGVLSACAQWDGGCVREVRVRNRVRIAAWGTVSAEL